MCGQLDAEPRIEWWILGIWEEDVVGMGYVILGFWIAQWLMVLKFNTKLCGTSWICYFLTADEMMEYDLARATNCETCELRLCIIMSYTPIKIFHTSTVHLHVILWVCTFSCRAFRTVLCRILYSHMLKIFWNTWSDVKHRDRAWCVLVIWIVCCMNGTLSVSVYNSAVTKHLNKFLTSLLDYMFLRKVYGPYPQRWVEFHTRQVVSALACWDIVACDLVYINLKKWDQITHLKLFQSIFTYIELKTPSRKIKKIITDLLELSPVRIVLWRNFNECVKTN